MARIILGTNWVNEDEPCFEYYEQDIQAPDNSGFRRYEVFRIMRKGRITELRKDIGSVELWRGVEPVVILGGVILPGGRMEIFETVGSMREIADQYRNHVHFDIKDLVRVDNLRLR